ncbi:CCR4-NOT transcription complex subunit 3 [Sarcoptes scabiei]|nr:CCR4-NOT transcription complex subunit 3 [Sarcoptes scabiei]
MADRRKLQAEIDRCIKKVNEGVEMFEDIWQKVHNATNANQKEKYEADLKKEIKKLQRLRDQIKSWLASSDIKDKRLLIDYRKLIETQMERFKVVERETKTKAYSKEGLGAAQKLDPAQKEKDEITNWLTTSIDSLSVQVDQFETEIENLQHSQKKSKKDREKLARCEFLKKRLEKHRYHIKQLETTLRMFDNETVNADQIKNIKDDIDYYIQSSTDSDFHDDESIYDELGLEDMQAFRANNVVDSTNVSAKNSTTSATKTETTAVAGTSENEENSVFSNPSSANESPAPSPGLQNSHSNKPNAINNTSNSTTSDDNADHEFTFTNIANTPIPSSPSSIITSSTSTAVCSSTASISSTTVPSSSVINNSNNNKNSGTGTGNIVTNNTVNSNHSSNKINAWPSTTPIKNSLSSITQSVTTTPYAAAVASSSSSTATNSSIASSIKVLGANELNDTRVQSMISPVPSSASSHHDYINHQPLPSPSPSSSASIGTAVSTSTISSTASGSTGPWNSNPPISNQIADNRNIRQMMNKFQLTPQQQYLLQQQQQQQQNNHILNGFKGIENLKGITHPTAGIPGSTSVGVLEDHLLDNRMMSSMNLNMSTSNANSPNIQNISQLPHLNEITNLSPNINNASMPIMDHLNHPNMIKTNMILHQQRNNSRLLQGSTPISSVSPPNTNNSTSSNNNPNIPTNLNSSANISLVETSGNKTQIQSNINQQKPQIQSQNYYNQNQMFSNQSNQSMTNKNIVLPKQLYLHLQLLESAFRHPIIPLDSYRLKPLMRLFPQITSPFSMSSYPNQTLSQFENVDFYQRLTPETLFFIFYYMEGTKAQYMAAKALKNKSWRFHTRFMMWFQRLEEPKVITDDYEQGTYIYFDFEKWAQRKKDNFMFEYRYLEDKDLN